MHTQTKTNGAIQNGQGMHLDDSLLWLFAGTYRNNTDCWVSCYNVLAIKLTKSSDMLNKNTWGVKKCEAKKNQ